MGQKINPFSLRLGVVKTWPARWFFKGGKQSYAKFLQEDEAIRKVVKDRINQAGIAGIEIERTSNNLRIFIRAARPGLIIGHGGKGIEELSKALEKALRKLMGPKDKMTQISLNVEELKRSDISAAYVAQQIAWDIERRMHFRRVIKKQVEQVMQNKDVKGIKVTAKGRLGGAEIARTETLKKGALPLQTLRADIDYGTATAFTTYGTIGFKVWIYKGEVFAKKPAQEKPEGRESNNRRA
jgi:small subunit ribosomal protein S3